jgi:transposase
MPLPFGEEDERMPKKFDAEVKARAVRMVVDHLPEYGSLTAASAAVGAQLGMGRETIRRWVTQADIDAGRRDGVTSEQLEEIRRLQAENKRLRETNEILRRASIFFAGELDPRNR